MDYSIFTALSSREIAVLLWITALLLFALSVSGIRSQIWGVIKAAVFSKLILVWLSLAGYVAALLWLLHSAGMWTDAYAKDTAIWFAFVAVAFPFQFHDTERAPNVSRTLARDGLSVMIVLEVLVNTYTFSLPVELVLVPMVTLLVAMAAFADLKEEHKPVASLLGKLQAILGLSLLGHALYRAVQSPTEGIVASISGAAMGVLLSLLCLPYIQALRLGFAYDDLLWRVGFKRDVSKRFKHYAALRILFHVRLHPNRILPFVRRNALRIFEVVDRSSLDLLLSEDRAHAAPGGASRSATA